MTKHNLNLIPLLEGVIGLENFSGFMLEIDHPQLAYTSPNSLMSTG